MLISILTLAVVVSWIIKDHKAAMAQLRVNRELGKQAENIKPHLRKNAA
jgi:hypothetical protein